MDVHILNKQKNPLLHREEILFEIKEAKTVPPRKELRRKIAALCNAKEDVVIVGKINQKFGLHYITGSANIYDSKEKMERIERDYLINKNLGIKKKKEEKVEEEEKLAAQEKAVPKEKAGEKGEAVKEGKGEVKEEKSQEEVKKGKKEEKKTEGNVKENREEKPKEKNVKEQKEE